MGLKLGEILVSAGAIDEAQLLAALGEQKSWGHRLGVTLVKMGFVTEAQLINALANQLRLPIAHLQDKRILPDVLALVPETVADQHMCLPLFVKDDGKSPTLYLGMDDPCNVTALDDLGFSTGMKVQPVLVAPSELCEAIDRFYRRSDGEPAAAAEPERPGAIEIGPEAATHEDELFPPLDLEDERPNPGTVQSAAPETLELKTEDIRSAGPVDPSSPRSGPSDFENNTRKILQQLTQLLIDNGVIDRDELAARLEGISGDP